LTDLHVGGLARLSTCDWPGQLAATVFCQGCGWDCAFCHNPDLIPAHSEAEIAWSEVEGFLEQRRGLLDAVVLSGGEPLLQPALPEALDAVRGLGFHAALHTNGQLPDRLSTVLPRLDWVGLDIKSPLSEYDRVTGVAGSAAKAFASLELLVASDVAHEVRTTVHTGLLSDDELLALAGELRAAGVRTWAVQAFRSDGTRPDRIQAQARGLSDEMLGRLATGFEDFSFRE